MVVTDSVFVSFEGNLLSSMFECSRWLFVPVKGFGVMGPKGVRILDRVLLHGILGVLHHEMTLLPYTKKHTSVFVLIRAARQ